MIGYETVLMIVLAIFTFKAGTTSLVGIPDFMILQLPLASFLIIYVGQVIVRVTPYDVVTAEPEISANLFTEYSGPKLAFIEMAEAMKNLAFYIMLSILLFGEAYIIPGVICFVLLYYFDQAVSPRYSTFRSALTFIMLAAVAFIDLFLVI